MNIDIDKAKSLKPSVMIVEDHADSLHLICDVLNKSGYIAVPTDSIASAREAFKTLNIDIILLDINLPDGIGLVFIEEIRRLDYKTKIIIVSALSKIEIDRLIEKYNQVVEGIITKPFIIENLLKEINNTLQMEVIF